MWLRARHLSASASSLFSVIDFVTKRAEKPFSRVEVDEKGKRTFRADPLVGGKAGSVLAQRSELPDWCCSCRSSLAAALLTSFHEFLLRVTRKLGHSTAARIADTFQLYILISISIMKIVPGHFLKA